MENKTLTPDQAINILDQASSKFQGNREDHVLIVQSLEMLRALIGAKDSDELLNENKE